MKTPREILLERHRAAVPKLDAIRREVVKELNNQDAKTESFPFLFAPLRLCCSNRIWSELIWPCRRVWSGLAAVWILIFAVNFSLHDNLSSVTGKPVRAPAAMMSWQTEQRLMNELLADRAVPADADRQRPVSPKPRTEKNGMMTA